MLSKVKWRLESYQKSPICTPPSPEAPFISQMSFLQMEQKKKLSSNHFNVQCLNTNLSILLALLLLPFQFMKSALLHYCIVCATSQWQNMQLPLFCPKGYSCPLPACVRKCVCVIAPCCQQGLHDHEYVIRQA